MSFDFNVATKLESQLNTALMTYVTSVSQALTPYAAGIAVTGTSLYFVYLGYASARGDVNEIMSKLMKDVFNMLLVAMVALNFGNYQNFVIEGMNALMSDMISRVTLGSGSTVGATIDHIFSDCYTIPGDSECTLTDLVYFKLALKNTNQLGIPDMSYLIAGLLLGVAEMVIVVCCLLPLLLSKTALAVFLAIGPVFILCLMWPATKNYFNSWLSAALGNVLTMIIIAAICSIVPRMFEQLLNDGFNGAYSKDIGFQVIGQTLILLIAALGLGLTALKASQMGAQLAGGGVAMDGSGMGGMVTNVWSNLKGSKTGGSNDKDKSGNSDTTSTNNNSAKEGSTTGYKAGNMAGRAVGNVLEALNKRK
jgi:type IV secretion system protein VirB6